MYPLEINKVSLSKKNIQTSTRFCISQSNQEPFCISLSKRAHYLCPRRRVQTENPHNEFNKISTAWRVSQSIYHILIHAASAILTHSRRHTCHSRTTCDAPTQLYGTDPWRTGEGAPPNTSEYLTSHPNRHPKS